jgi:hypothetical protein
MLTRVSNLTPIRAVLSSKVDRKQNYNTGSPFPPIPNLYQLIKTVQLASLVVRDTVRVWRPSIRVVRGGPCLDAPSFPDGEQKKGARLHHDTHRLNTYTEYNKQIAPICLDHLLLALGVLPQASLPVPSASVVREASSTL